jgi:2-keto-4-pentenoate hydratase/2-oxohepta-3-ene-1,7-dioic acid hydratase in catechol pathway
LKLLRFTDHTGVTGYGSLENETIIELSQPGIDWLKIPFQKTGRVFDLQQVKLLAPCLPSKAICLGLNYRSHAEEMGHPLPDAPILFMKPSTAVIGPGEAIICPPESRRVDYEAELAVVMGRKTYRVRREEALQYVFGYTCGNDVTARDKQPADGQWTYAKGFDTFCPLGPVIETAIDDPETLILQGFLNGKLVQESSTQDHHFSVAEIIEFVSHCMTLLPGDVIMTGTPSGIGPLKPGDKFMVKIEGIGALDNPAVKL